MTPDNNSLSSQMQLGDTNFSIYFVNKDHYQKAWVNTTHPGEGDCMADSYAYISYGMLPSIFIAEDFSQQILDTDQIYDTVKQYLDEHYNEERW
jgi:hypothetical protein